MDSNPPKLVVHREEDRNFAHGLGNFIQTKPVDQQAELLRKAQRLLDMFGGKITEAGVLTPEMQEAVKEIKR